MTKSQIGSVTLVYFKRRWREGDTLQPAYQDFPSLAAAIQHVQASTGSQGFCDPFIMNADNGGDLLWEPRFGNVICQDR